MSGFRLGPKASGAEPDVAVPKLFVKLPAWFLIDTPVGKYNPDWAILKHNGQALYLVRETKGTRDFLKLRTLEADKVRCGLKHFETLGVPFAVVVTADEV
jgi:type III restriction enzyme